MSANQACFPIAAMARVLGVSKAMQRPPSARATACVFRSNVITDSGGR
jgi:hypothetical protein